MGINSQIILRAAKAGDIQDIFELLFGEHMGWSKEDIVNNLPGFFVLIHGEKIVGVLNGDFSAGKGKVFWVVIHPMYPKSSLSAAMIQGLWGTICRKPEFDRSWDIMDSGYRL